MQGHRHRYIMGIYMPISIPYFFSFLSFYQFSSLIALSLFPSLALHQFPSSLIPLSSFLHYGSLPSSFLWSFCFPFSLQFFCSLFFTPSLSPLPSSLSPILTSLPPPLIYPSLTPHPSLSHLYAPLFLLPFFSLS